jgi:hypothetical protein
MPSPAARLYRELNARARVILQTNRDHFSREDVQALFGASFVAQVAAWNAYVVAAIPVFFDELANPALPAFQALHTLARDAAMARLERFNTPNSKNTREILQLCTGYDPWPDWHWPARGLNSLGMRNRLDEVLQVRHSFAHGFAMPAYSWNTNASGERRLTLRALSETAAFLRRLVLVSDTGLRTHLSAVHGVAPPW